MACKCEDFLTIIKTYQFVDFLLEYFNFLNKTRCNIYLKFSLA